MTPKRHVLHPCCRVRNECFGLLFYDLRGPRLLFAATGAQIDGAGLGRGQAVEDCVRSRAPTVARSLGVLIEQLVEKGFLREQPVC